MVYSLQQHHCIICFAIPNGVKAQKPAGRKLEKGEYDWAHLAYSIWPDRVANKCKKDLSMAIAHGLESICEIKPKEKKSRKKPEIKVETQDKLL